MNYREECLRKANECVNGGREHDYGTPEDNFKTIADLWEVYLDHPITKRDVVIMMILLKIARVKTGAGTNDCYVDIAGYSACGYELNSLMFDHIQDILDRVGLGDSDANEEPESDDEYLCYDSFSDRYFRSNMDRITRALTTVDYKLNTDGYACVNDIYSELGLTPIRGERGWIDELSDKVDISFDSSLSSTGEPCIVLNINSTDY